MKKFIIISLSLFGFYACQVTEEMNTGNDLDSMRLECMLTSDDSDPVHYLYLDRFYAIKEGQYYRQSPELIHPVFSVESNGKSVQVVEDASLEGRYILQGEFNHGDEISIRLSGNGVSDASALTSIPEAPTNDCVQNLSIKEFVKNNVGGAGLIEYHISFMLKGSDSYYGLALVTGEGSDIQETALVPDGVIEILPGEKPEFSTSFPISAPILRLTDGKIVNRNASRAFYVLSGAVSEDNSPVSVSSVISVYGTMSAKPRVRVYRLTKEAHRACMSVFSGSRNDLEGFGLTSAASAWTNVKGGQGYFCGYSFKDFQ